ncbi:MAG: glycoside hydrolase family 127 protein [Acidobacteriaceae bacterium]
MSLKHLSRRKFVGSLAVAAGSTLLPSRALGDLFQDPVVNQARNNAPSAERVPWKALPFPMKQVRLLPGAFKTASDRNLAYMKSLPKDRLMHTFRLNAGLPSSAKPFGGWEAPDCELRGHFDGGHYLSACALAYASTGDEEIKRRGDSLVAELAKCQQRSGFLSAFPEEFFDRLRERKKVWAPFYTIHKIMAGHLDMYTLTGNEQALDTLKKMAAWVGDYSGPISYDHWQDMLKTEYGGMGEVMANLAAVGGERRGLFMARRFDKNSFFDPLADHQDQLRGLHANTHIPQVIAAARIYDLSGDTKYRDIAEYFWNEITSERSYAHGGTSNDEMWNTDPGKLSTALGPMTAEDCCAYNMLKLTRHLFGWEPQARYMDYYERALFNHRLGTMDPETGTTMYYYPLAAGYSKVYAKPFDSFWCCNGTGVEEFAKFNDSIYFHDDSSIFVNLFIPSELDWPEKNFKLRQETDFPRQQGTKLTVMSDAPSEIALRVRIPYWARGGQVKVNGHVLPAFASPSSYLTLLGPWKKGDAIEVSLPMDLHLWHMPDDDSVQAVMYGPLVLAGKYGEAPREHWYDSEYERKTTPGPAAPAITADVYNATSWVEPTKEPLMFRGGGQAQPITLVPMSHIVHEDYGVYWKVTPKKA